MESNLYPKGLLADHPPLRTRGQVLFARVVALLKGMKQ